jgi:RNA polymerase primary sigma factor
VKANLRFVINVARAYQNQGLPLADLINEGNMGMMRAARRFDERKNFRFITYAVWWIRQGILRALADHGRVVKLPLNRVGALYRIGRAHGRLEQRFGRTPTTDEIASELHLRPSVVRVTLAAGAGAVSLDAPVQDDDGLSVVDCLQVEGQELPDTEIEARSHRDEIERVLDVLEPREKEIVKLYYGMDGEDPYSLEEIGQVMHITRERARQLKQRALIHLRRSGGPLLSQRHTASHAPRSRRTTRVW